MKKCRIIAAALVLVSVSLLSCKTNTSDVFKTGGFATDSVSYNYGKTVLLELKDGTDFQQDEVADSTEISINVLVEYPKSNGKNTVAVKIIRDWMNEELSAFNKYEKVYDGDPEDAEAFVKFYGDSYKEFFTKPADFPAPALSYDISIMKEFENDKCVTYTFLIDQYLGGAHGGRTYFGKTFRKEDGKVFDNFLAIRDIEDSGLDSLIKKGLMEFWNISDEEVLYQYTWENKVSKYFVEKPAISPCFVKDGILFCYQEYEIAAYAAGAPIFVVPYSEIEKYLTPSAADLLK